MTTAIKKNSPDDLAQRMIKSRRTSTSSNAFPDLADPSRSSLHRDLPISEIYTSPYQRRTKIDTEYVRTLADTIASNGLLQDILVREISDGKYELVAGENRLAAYRLLGREKISAVIRSMTDMEAARALTVDNIQHKRLTDFETYLHFQMLYDSGFVATDEEMAELIGKSRVYVTKTKAFSDLPKIALDILKEYPDAISYEIAAKLRSTGLNEQEPTLVASAIKEISENRLKQSSAVRWINEQRKSRTGQSKQELLISDNQFLHKRRLVRIVVKEGSFQISAQGLDGKAIEEMVMSKLAELIK